MQSITLILPELLPPPAVVSETDLPDCKTLQRLLARAEHRRLQDDIDTLLWARFSSHRQSPPHAALSYLADHGESSQQHVMRADPVHLSASREGVVLFDNTMLQLQADEAESLAEVVRPLLQEFGVGLTVAQPSRWYLLCNEPPRIETWPLSEVIGCNVSDRLPGGANATRWRQLFNEIQMLLHETPVNQARERRGQLSVNSLWFWGEGTLPPTGKGEYDLCLTDDPVMTGMARHLSITAWPLPANVRMLMDRMPNAAGYRHVVLMDNRPRQLRAYQNTAGWLDYVAALETNWMQPLRQALLRGRFKTLRLVTGSDEYICRRWQQLRLWRQTGLAPPADSQ